MTTRNTSKTKPSAEKSLPAEVSEMAKPVQSADPQAIEEGLLWTLGVDGKLYNMLEEPPVFDKVITGYVELFDRVTWPVIQRSIAIAAARGTIPTFYIAKEHLTAEQKQRLEELHAATTNDSVQAQVLTEEVTE